MVNSFTIYKEYYELITLLSEREQQELLLAITRYMFEDIEPTLNSKQTKIFNNLKRPLDKSKEQSKRKRNRNQTETEKEPKENQTETKKNPKENQSSNQTETHQDVPVTVNVNVNVKDSFSYLEEQFGRTLSPVEYKLISKWRSWFSYDIINYAIDKTIKNGARGLSYTEAIINSWHDKGFKTLRECELEDKSRSMKEHMPETYKDVKSIHASDDEVKKLEEALNEVS